MRALLCLLAAAASAQFAFAQNAPHIRDWKPASSESAQQPVIPCAQLHLLTGYDLSVISADSVAASAEAPAFCRVLLLVQPEIKIEVALPLAWNQRLYMFGNGGYAGEDLEAPGRIAHRNAALKHGFAVTQTNTGHDAAREPLATFTTHPQKTLDYAFRSLHVTVETAKRAAQNFYGARPKRSYYNGCSTGGRQGLVFAQRYPEDFDGIIAGAPALAHVANRLRSISTYQALSKAPIPTAKLKALAAQIYARCDAVDGLKDGLITDPRRCDFQPSRDLPTCQASDTETCFTPGQIKALETIYADLTLNGKRIAPGFPVGAEIAGPTGKSGWDGWIIRDEGMSQSATYADAALKYWIFDKPNPAYDMKQFNLEQDARRFDPIGKIMNATDPDLSRFRDRGGKLLMYFGWADPALNPRTGVEYYEEVTRTLGPSTRNFFRLYMLPGVFHCSGGVGPACFDPLSHLIPWVEQNKAPEAIQAEQPEGPKVVRTRPLCPYPQTAKYTGQGNPNEAQNFSCVTPN